MLKIIGLIAGFLGAIVAGMGAVMAFQIFQQIPVLCPADPACESARGAAWIAVFGSVVGVVTMIAGFMIRRRAE